MTKEKSITGGEVEEPALIFPDHQAAVSDDLLFRLEYWGNFDYKTGCEYAHQILLDYRDVIYSVLERAKSGHLKTTGAMAYVVLTDGMAHVFSTQQKANDYASNIDGAVIYDYLVDIPERATEVKQ